MTETAKPVRNLEVFHTDTGDAAVRRATRVDADQVLSDANRVPVSEDLQAYEHLVDERAVRARMISDQVEVSPRLNLGVISRNARVRKDERVSRVATDRDDLLFQLENFNLFLTVVNLQVHH